MLSREFGPLCMDTFLIELLSIPIFKEVQLQHYWCAGAKGTAAWVILLTPYSATSLSTGEF